MNFYELFTFLIEKNKYSTLTQSSVLFKFA